MGAKTRGIVTYTSDYGKKNFYAAALKGLVLTGYRNTTFVDVCHEVNKYDISEAAFILRAIWHTFPESTIHLTDVNSYYERPYRQLVASYNSHFFIGPDNGLLPLLELDFDAVHQLVPGVLKNKSFSYLNDLVAPAIITLLNENTINTVGEPFDKMLLGININPIVEKNLIRGVVRHIDEYHNVITNITEPTFRTVGQGRLFNLILRGARPLQTLVNYYGDVDISERLCRFNSSGFLEISINRGAAAKHLGLRLDDYIQIEFRDSTPR